MMMMTVVVVCETHRAPSTPPSLAPFHLWRTVTVGREEEGGKGMVLTGWEVLRRRDGDCTPGNAVPC